MPNLPVNLSEIYIPLNTNRAKNRTTKTSPTQRPNFSIPLSDWLLEILTYWGVYPPGAFDTNWTKDANGVWNNADKIFIGTDFEIDPNDVLSIKGNTSGEGNFSYAEQYKGYIGNSYLGSFQSSRIIGGEIITNSVSTVSNNISYTDSSGYDNFSTQLSITHNNFNSSIGIRNNELGGEVDPYCEMYVNNPTLGTNTRLVVRDDNLEIDGNTGWSGTYLNGSGQTVTVVKGLITNVA